LQKQEQALNELLKDTQKRIKEARTAQQKFHDDLMAAMKQQNPQTEQLMQQLQQKGQQIRQMHGAAIHTP